MKIMKVSKLFITAIAGLLTVGCYNDFNLPQDVADNKPVVYTDNYMQQVLGLEYKTIEEIKNMFGTISNTGSTNDDWSQTMYKRFVTNKNECTDFERQTNRYIEGNYYIKGKVISNDEQGNVYRSLHIYDGTAAIELKLTNGMYLEYPCDVREGGQTMWVYVKLTGLYLGNFRMMLSIGDIPTEGYNSVGRRKCYPNSNISSPEKVREHVFKGESDVLTATYLNTNLSNCNDADILKIDENNYSVLRNPKLFGRLMMFEGVKVMYQGVTDQDGKTPAMYPSSGVDPTPYPSWQCTSGTMQGYINEAYVAKPWGKLAYSMNNTSLYGQMLVGYNENASGTNNAGVYVVRTSGYARYANRYVPKNGAKGSLLAIYSIYATRSDYSGSSSDYATYQLTPCRFEDMLPEYYSSMTAEDEAKMAAWASCPDPRALDTQYSKFTDYDEKGEIPLDSFYLPQTQDDDDLD